MKNTSLIEHFCVPEKKEKLDDSENINKENDSKKQCSAIFQKETIDTEQNSDILQNKNINITEKHKNILSNRSVEQNAVELRNSKEDEPIQEICDGISVNKNLSNVEEDSKVKEILISMEEIIPEESKLSLERSIESKSLVCSSSEDVEEQKCVENSEYCETTDGKATIDNLVPIEFDEFEERGVKSILSPHDFESIKRSFCERLSKSHHEAVPTVRFRAVIDPSKNQQAEKELSKEISKDMFKKVCYGYNIKH